MLTLALDCSFSGLSLGLFAPNMPPATFTSPTPRSSDILHTQLLQLFKQSNQTPANLTHITLTLGPGSFTGCRIGLAVAQAFQVVNPALTLIGISTLQALAEHITQAHRPTQPFTILLDAAGAQAYHQTFSPQAAALTPAQCAPINQILTNLNPTHLLAAPTTMLLPRQPNFTFATLPPEIIFTTGQNPAHHLPLQPIYLKPLNYQQAPTHV